MEPGCRAPEKPSEADLARARDLREGLQALLLANSGYPLDAAAVQRLDDVARGARLEVRVDPGGSTRFESVSRARTHRSLHGAAEGDHPLTAAHELDS